MPFNGTGTFVRVYNWVTDQANGILVNATRMDTEMDGLATGLSNALTRDGQSPPTANIPFGSYKITGLGTGSAPTDGVNFAQVFTNPNFAGMVVTGVANLAGASSVTVPTMAAGTNSTAAASTAFAVQLAFSAALPAQPGGAPKYLLGSTLGVASWVLPPLANYSARTSNTILVATDSGSVIDITSGTFSQTFTAAATLGNGWYCYIRNSGTGVITLDPNGAELIDSLASYPMYGQEVRLIQCDGAAFKSIVVHPFYCKSATTYTHIDPPGYTAIGVDLVGAGAGGGAGRRGAAGTARAGGCPGGTPARVQRILTNRVAGTSTTVTIGAPGTGGAAQGSDSADGAAGTVGGNTTFGSLVTAYGGAAGLGGTTTNGTTSGSGSMGAGTSVASGGVAGGLPSIPAILGATLAPDNVGEGGAASATGTTLTGGNSEWGGAGSSLVSIAGTGTPTGAGSSIRGVGASSMGGWITSGNTMPAKAGDAGQTKGFTAGGGAVGGTCGAAPTVGADGAANAGTDFDMGNSGAGGGSSITAAAKKGGNGTAPGGAGGGGGASLNGNASGAGGDGAAGRSVVWGIV